MNALGRQDFESFIRMSLNYVDPVLCSDAAVSLLLGTAAVESDFGKHRVQHGGGPALGVFQMEGATFNWLKDVKFGAIYPAASMIPFALIEHDLFAATIFCRLRYRAVPTALPAADDIAALAAYWKRWYNTEAGRGTTAKFMEAYELHVLSG